MLRLSKHSEPSFSNLLGVYRNIDSAAAELKNTLL